MCEDNVFPVAMCRSFHGTVVVNTMPFCIMTDTSHRQSSRTKGNPKVIDLLCRAGGIVVFFSPWVECDDGVNLGVEKIFVDA